MTIILILVFSCYILFFCHIYNKWFADSLNIVSDIFINKSVWADAYPFFFFLLIVRAKYKKNCNLRFLLNSFFQHLTWRSGCLTSSCIELQTLLGYCLTHLTITILRHFFYLVYFLPYLGPGIWYIFVNYFTFYILSFFFILVNHITSLEQTHLFFVHFVEHFLLFLDDNVDEKSEKFSNSESSASGSWLHFA